MRTGVKYHFILEYIKIALQLAAIFKNQFCCKNYISYLIAGNMVTTNFYATVQLLITSGVYDALH